MTDTYTIRATAKFTSRALLFVSQPDSCRFPTCDEKFIPESLTELRKHLLLPAISNGKPYIPGSSIRGALRGHAYKVLLETADEMKGEYQKVRFAQMVIDTKGGVTVPASESMTYEAIDRIRDNRPMIDAFGCNTPGFIAGRLMVGGLFPATDNYKLTPLPVNRKNPLREQPNLINRLSDPEAIREWEVSGRATSDASAEVRSLTKQLKAATDATEKEKLEEDLKNAKEKVKNNKSAKADERKDDVLAAPAEALSYVHTHPSDYAMAFPSELEYDHLIHINDAPTKTIGLILAGIKSWAAMGIVGGKAASGAGGFLKGEYEFEKLVDNKWVKFADEEWVAFAAQCHEDFRNGVATADLAFLG